MNFYRRDFIKIVGLSSVGFGLNLSNPVFANNATEEELIVKTKYGKLKGNLINQVGIFKGVPYAGNSDGKNRFLSPRPLKKWKGIYEATGWGPKSYQLPMNLPPEALKQMKLDEGRANEMDENCQSINIWAPSVKTGKKLPVMFWCHGGGFTAGSGSGSVFDGYNMAVNGNVVVVNVTHRLGPLGFLYLGHIDKKYEASANVGMLDIVAALEWVKDNIAEFGGDPDNVTIFGQSGGGGKVATLMAMPSAKGLFHKAIMQSGAFLKGLTKEEAISTTNALFDNLGIERGDIDALLKADPMALVEKSQSVLNTEDPSKGLTFNFAPVVDNVSLTRNPFEPDAAETCVDIPLIIGTNKDEFAVPLTDGDAIIENIRAQHGSDTDPLLAAYLKDYPDYPLVDVYSIYSADLMMRMNSIKIAERKYQQKAPVYMYLFNYGILQEGNSIPKSGHSMEISFVFNNPESPIVPGVPVSDDTIALAGIMSRAWTSFAHTGNPNHKELPNWEKYDLDNRATMIFDTECKAVNDPAGNVRKILNKH